MSQIIPLEAIPNQQVSVVLDGHRFEVTLKEAGGMMVATIVRDGATIISSVRAVAGGPLLPYRYLEGDAGNFIFTTASMDGTFPYWTDFNSGTQLVYTSAAELAEIRNGLA